MRRHTPATLAGTLVIILALVAIFPSARSSQQSPTGQPAGSQTPAQGRGRGPGAQPRARKALLAWADTRNGQAQHAFTSHALAVIERLGYESGLWDTFIRTDSHIIFNQAQKTDGTPASGGPSLSNVDGIFFLGHREVPINDQQKAELLAFVRNGKGFVAAHTGLTAFESWPEFGELIGGRFDQHPIVGAGTIINESPNFPATRHFPATFAFNDEFYQPKNLSRDKVEVLLRLDLTNVPANPALHVNGDYPLAWAKMYGKRRLLYGSFAQSSE